MEYSQVRMEPTLEYWNKLISLDREKNSLTYFFRSVIDTEKEFYDIDTWKKEVMVILKSCFMKLLKLLNY